jgi:hypothetical protein
MASFPGLSDFDAALYTGIDEPQARAADPAEERDRLQSLLARELLELQPLSLAACQ